MATLYHPPKTGHVEVPNWEIKKIMQKTFNGHQKDWAKNLNNTLWAYRTSYEMPIGSSPHLLVYGKTCYLFVELEYQVYSDVNKLNLEIKTASEKRFLPLEELNKFHLHVYENDKLYKGKTKIWHDRDIHDSV